MQDRFIGPLPREGSVGCTSDYVSQSYSYSSVLSKSETGIMFSLVKALLICYYFSILWNSSIFRILKRNPNLLGGEGRRRNHHADIFSITFSMTSLHYGRRAVSHPYLLRVQSVQFKLSGTLHFHINPLLCPWLRSCDCITKKYSSQAVFSVAA